jgi:hypothetical protein
MTEQDIKNKNLVLISYLNTLISGFKIKAEYSTNDNDIKVIVVTETSGEKTVFYGDIEPLFNYYDIQIYGDNIEECKNIAVEIGNLIGQMTIFDYEVKTKTGTETQKWQLIFQQFANPRTIQYMDIRRIAYTMTLKCVVNRVA